jgi:di/tricarboxylate transporter
MLIARCTSTEAARNSVEWSVLLVIAAAFGIGTAIEKSGLAGLVITGFLDVAHGSPFAVLVAMYLVTTVLTEVITNNAAVALVFPVAIGAAERLGVNLEPFIYSLMLAGSASFATPIGYQTNLMVMGPGGYRYVDYIRIGVPLNLALGAITVTLAPLIWPF